MIIPKVVSNSRNFLSHHNITNLATEPVAFRPIGPLSPCKKNFPHTLYMWLVKTDFIPITKM